MSEFHPNIESASFVRQRYEDVSQIIFNQQQRILQRESFYSTRTNSTSPTSIASHHYGNDPFIRVNSTKSNDPNFDPKFNQKSFEFSDLSRSDRTSVVSTKSADSNKSYKTSFHDHPLNDLSKNDDDSSFEHGIEKSASFKHDLNVLSSSQKEHDIPFIDTGSPVKQSSIDLSVYSNSEEFNGGTVLKSGIEELVISGGKSSLDVRETAILDDINAEFIDSEAVVKTTDEILTESVDAETVFIEEQTGEVELLEEEILANGNWNSNIVISNASPELNTIVDDGSVRNSTEIVKESYTDNLVLKEDIGSRSSIVNDQINKEKSSEKTTTEEIFTAAFNNLISEVQLEKGVASQTNQCTADVRRHILSAQDCEKLLDDLISYHNEIANNDADVITDHGASDKNSDLDTNTEGRDNQLLENINVDESFSSVECELKIVEDFDDITKSVDDSCALHIEENSINEGDIDREQSIKPDNRKTSETTSKRVSSALKQRSNYHVQSTISSQAKSIPRVRPFSSGQIDQKDNKILVTSASVDSTHDRYKPRARHSVGSVNQESKATKPRQRTSLSSIPIPQDSVKIKSNKDSKSGEEEKSKSANAFGRGSSKSTDSVRLTPSRGAAAPRQNTAPRETLKPNTGVIPVPRDRLKYSTSLLVKSSHSDQNTGDTKKGGVPEVKPKPKVIPRGTSFNVASRSRVVNGKSASARNSEYISSIKVNRLHNRPETTDGTVSVLSLVKTLEKKDSGEVIEQSTPIKNLDAEDKNRVETRVCDLM